MADRTIPRIAPAPRRIPPGVLATIVASRNFTGTLWLFIPAVVAAGIAAAGPTQEIRNAILVVDAILVLLGMRMVAKSLLESRRTLQRMREGSLTLGRITTCRNAWDGRKADMPYRKFLPQWVTHTGRSQASKAIGCGVVAFGVVFLLPFALMGITIAAVVAVRALGIADAPGPDEPATRELVAWLAYLAISMAVIWAFLRFLKWYVVFRTEGTINEGIRRERGDDADARQLEAMKFDPLQRMTLQVPLPQDASADLHCGVEYTLGGERRTGEGRLGLSDRLDLSGIEALLADPDGHPQVLFLEWLPPKVRLDARGEWEDLPPIGPGVQFAMVMLAATVAIAAFAPGVPAVIARILH